MAESNAEVSQLCYATQACRRASSPSWPLSLSFLLFSILVPVAAALLVLYRYQLDPFDPAALPLHELSERVNAAPKRNNHMLKGSEFIGVGALMAPEDVAYDSKSGLIYTGSADGWVKRVTLNKSAVDSVVENWVNTGGRPLGLAQGHDGELLVAHIDKVSVTDLSPNKYFYLGSGDDIFYFHFYPINFVDNS